MLLTPPLASVGGCRPRPGGGAFAWAARSPRCRAAYLTLAIPDRVGQLAGPERAGAHILVEQRVELDQVVAAVLSLMRVYQAHRDVQRLNHDPDWLFKIGIVAYHD